MKNLLKGLLVAAFAASQAVALAQVTFKGVGPSVKAKVIDTTKFNPQIDASAKTTNFEKDHEFKFNYPAGTPNNLFLGGVLTSERASIANSYLFPGISATGAEPPDPDIAVGPNHVVEVVNSSIAFYKKDGTKVLEQTFQNFFKTISPEAFDFDPKVIYDQLANRFVVLDLGLNDASSGGTASLLIAVSATSNPSGSWSLYKIDVKQTEGSNNYWWDYPGLGYSKDMIVATGNMFAMQGSSGFNGVQVVAFDKTALYAGTATPNKFKVADGFTMQLAKTQDSTTSPVFGVETNSGTSMRLTAITKSGSTFAVKQAVVAVPQWNQDQGFITGPGGVVVQTNDPRQLVASSYNGSVVSSHSVAVSSSDRRPAARWYQFTLGTWPTSGAPTLKMSGQVDPPSGHGYSFPAVSFDTRGNIGMTFSKIGSSTPGDVMGTGRRSGDANGVMGAPILLEKSTASQYNGFSTRWGDYFDLEIDPADGKTMWAVGMGAGSSVGGRWQTYMKSFKIALNDVDLSFINPNPVTVSAGTYQSGNAASLGATDGQAYRVLSTLVNGLGDVAGIQGVYQSPFTNIDTLRMYVTVTGPTGSSTIISLKNVKTGAWDTFQTMGMNGSPVSKAVEFTADQMSKYVSTTGVITANLRCVFPNRTGKAAAYTLAVDQFNFGAYPKS